MLSDLNFEGKIYKINDGHKYMEYEYSNEKWEDNNKRRVQ